MRKIFLKYLTGYVFTIGALVGCGGGGGGGDGGTTSTPAKAILTISSQGTLPAGTAMSGCSLMVHFPTSVTVQTDGAGAVSSEVVAPSGGTVGQASVLISPLVPGQLSFVLTSTAVGGFGPGEFVTVHFTVAPGSSPQAADFSLSNLGPVSLTGVALSGLTPTFTMAIQ